LELGIYLKFGTWILMLGSPYTDHFDILLALTLSLSLIKALSQALFVLSSAGI